MPTQFCELKISSAVVDFAHFRLKWILIVCLGLGVGLGPGFGSGYGPGLGYPRCLLRVCHLSALISANSSPSGAADSEALEQRPSAK